MSRNRIKGVMQYAVTGDRGSRQLQSQSGQREERLSQRRQQAYWNHFCFWEVASLVFGRHNRPIATWASIYSICEGRPSRPLSPTISHYNAQGKQDFPWKLPPVWQASFSPLHQSICRTSLDRGKANLLGLGSCIKARLLQMSSLPKGPGNKHIAPVIVKSAKFPHWALLFKIC